MIERGKIRRSLAENLFREFIESKEPLRDWICRNALKDAKDRPGLVFTSISSLASDILKTSRLIKNLKRKHKTTVNIYNAIKELSEKAADPYGQTIQMAKILILDPTAFELVDYFVSSRIDSGEEVGHLRRAAQDYKHAYKIMERKGAPPDTDL